MSTRISIITIRCTYQPANVKLGQTGYRSSSNRLDAIVDLLFSEKHNDGDLK